MTPHRLTASDDPQPVLALLREAFAYMEGRIDPPSSLHRLTADGVRAQATAGEVWLIGPASRPVACVFLTPEPEALYIGKLAVAQSHRGEGLARALIDLAEERARALGLPALELKTRIELVENHATFARLGFVQTAENKHPGFARVTSLTFTKTL